jgi:hypothetical protein
MKGNMYDILLAIVAGLFMGGIAFFALNSLDKTDNAEIYQAECIEKYGAGWVWKDVIAGDDICVEEKSSEVRYL